MFVISMMYYYWLKYPSVNTILSPTTADIVGSMLLEIENVRTSKNLQ